ncbi:MAG: DUF2752 domain-containing protein [Blautia sp.]|nr:DUF2752 domain-containing protein [Blautia sp.]
MLILYSAITYLVFHTFCPLVIAFGYSCPACGLTRAGISLLHGNFRLAITYNAMIFIWIPYLLWILVFRYLLGKPVLYYKIITIFTGVSTFFYYLFRIISGTLIKAGYPGLFQIFSLYISNSRK